MTSVLYTIVSLIIPYVVTEKNAWKILSRMRLVSNSWNNAVTDYFRRKTRLNIVSNSFLTPSTYLERIGQQESFTLCVASMSSNVREFIFDFDTPSAPFTTSPIFWHNLQPLAAQLRKFQLNGVALIDTRQFFRSFLVDCRNLETFSWRQNNKDDVQEFDEYDDDDAAVRAFSNLKQLQHLSLHANSYSGHARFLTAFTNAENLKTVDVWLWWYRHQDILSRNFAQLISNCVRSLTRFHSSRCLSLEILRALSIDPISDQPIDDQSLSRSILQELKIYIDPSTINYEEEGETLRRSFRKFGALSNLWLEFWNNIHQEQIDPRILTTILDSCSLSLKKLCLKGNGSKIRGDKTYLENIEKSLTKLAPSIEDLKLDDSVLENTSQWVSWPSFVNLTTLHLCDHGSDNFNFLCLLISLKHLELNIFAKNRLNILMMNYLPSTLEYLKIVSERRVSADMLDTIARDGANLKKLSMAINFDQEKWIDQNEWKNLLDNLLSLRRIELFDDGTINEKSMLDVCAWARQEYRCLTIVYSHAHVSA